MHTHMHTHAHTHTHTHTLSLSLSLPPAITTDDALRGSITVDSLSTRVVPCPYRQSLLAGEIDPATYAETFVPTTRTWSNSTFESGLSGTRSEQERAALADEMFTRYAARITKKPQDHGMDYVHAYLRFHKN